MSDGITDGYRDAQEPEFEVPAIKCFEKGERMNWQQKALALHSLSGTFNFSLHLREDGTWFVNLTGIERKEGRCLSSGCQVAKTPEQAIEGCWAWATESGYYLVKGASSDDRRAFKWNGFMWEEIEEENSEIPKPSRRP